jgi:hypothetical protein
MFPPDLFRCHAREGGHPVITGVSVYWIPACAGMTVICVATFRRNFNLTPA